MASFKVALIGNSGSGKSHTLTGLTGKSSGVCPSFGVHSVFYRHYVLWDCPGKQEFLGLGSGYYQGSAIVIVFEGGEEFRTPEEWIEEVPAYSEVYQISGTHEEKLDQVREILG